MNPWVEKFKELSREEAAVVWRVAQGYQDHEIARQLNIPMPTVHTRLSGVYRKLSIWKTEIYNPRVRLTVLWLMVMHPGEQEDDAER